MQIYYINLDQRPDRRQSIEAQLQKLGLAAERIAATTPKDLSPGQLARYCDPRRGHWLMPQEFCCGLSHIKTLETFLAGAAPYALVLEDDAVLSARLPRFLAGFDATPHGIDLLRIETDLDPVRIKFAAPNVEIEGVSLGALFSWTYGSAAYIISRHAAALAIQSGQFLIKPADQVLCNPYEPVPRRVVFRQAVPALATQADRLQLAEIEASDIVPFRKQRRAAQKPHYWRRVPYEVGVFINRDIVVAAQKAWHQWARGAEKRSVPFLAE